MQIPIRNIYFLLSYAWKYYKPSDIRKIVEKDLQMILNFAEVFDLTLSKYVKRDYIEIIEKAETIKTIKVS